MKNHAKQNSVRVIAGQWRGTKIQFASSEGLRPTADRTRETLFNWLAPYIEGARCLDLFAGSGIMSFEALSRGAASAVALDTNRQVVQQLEREKARLEALDLDIVHADAMRWLQSTANTEPACQADIVFVDPPFDKHYQQRVVDLLGSGRWLAKDALVYFELPQTDGLLALPGSWRQLREKMAGNVRYGLYQCGN